MGAFFTNLHVRAEDRDAVIRALRLTASLPAYVTKPATGWVSVYPRATEKKGSARLEEFAQLVSAALHTTILGFRVHNSDTFHYVLCADGATRDLYASRPATDEPPQGGSVDALLPFCRNGTTAAQLEEVLRRKQVARRALSPDEQKQVKKEIETKKRRLKQAFPQMRKEIEEMGLPTPSLEQMLEHVDSVGDKMMGHSGDAVGAEELAAALALLIGLPGRRGVRGYTEISEGDPAPGALAAPILK